MSAAVAAAAAERGEAVPQSSGIPEVWDVCMAYWSCFTMLSNSRGSGMNGPLPLAYSEIAAYAKDHGLADDEYELDITVRIVQGLDEAYLKHHHAARRRPTPPSPA